MHHLRSQLLFIAATILPFPLALFAQGASTATTPPKFAFSAPKKVDVGSVSSNVTAVALAGDLNGDGNTDVIAVWDNAPHVLLGNGEGGFTLANGNAPSGFQWSGNPDQNMGLIDLNGDGKLDLWELFPSAIDPSQCDQGPTLLTTWMGDGKGGFGDPVSYQLDPVDTIESTWGDFNNDGKPDFAVYTYNNDGSNCGIEGPKLTVLLNNGDGTLAPSGRSTGLALLSRSTPVALGPQSTATFNPSTNNSSTTVGFADMTSGDFNGDGKTDLVMANHGDVDLLYGDGKGGFTTGYHYTVDSQVITVAAADLNGDGKTDLVLGLTAKNAPGAHPRIATLLAKRAGGLYWAFATSIPNPGETGLIYPQIGALKDFNGDGKLDVMITNGTKTTAQMLILGGEGGGKFAPSQTFVTLSNITASNSTGGVPSAVAPLKTGGLPDVFLMTGYFPNPPPEAYFEYMANQSK